ncbi:T9SS type A sorting domain-containing protein [Hymenobacter edaphi]|uniref:Secretion system C-terminal sorting domain-containing protein n=1 Tax=Hymenobacter edaphi TaxID=2211146 RepID=A0A328BW07_9BACT|nr:T9SS type A sorting domain-containing protein [Hymenobacter edaphi]RAK70701.1 hypothetical protein DLM85_07710 [Hymenobacter edaphi]
MKQPLLFLCSLLGLSAPLLAQTDDSLTSRPRPANPYAQWLAQAARADARAQASATVRVSTRSSTYWWVAAAGQWADQATVTTSAYNAEGRIVAALVVDSASQRPSLRRSYIRNAAGITSEFRQEEWTGSAWLNKQRYVNTFDSQNRIVTQTYQLWNGAAWADNYRLVVTYNSHGAQDSFFNQAWLNGAWVTQYGAQSVLVYDAADRVTQETQSTFNATTGLVEPFVRYQYVYIGSMQLADIFTVQRSNGGQWVNEQRQRLISADGQQRRLLTHSEGWTGLSWQLTARTSYSYSPTTASSVEVQETPQGTGWVNDRKTSYDYNSRGILTGYRSETWLNGSWRLVAGHASLPTYNATDDLIIQQEQAAVRTGSGTAAAYVLTNQQKTYYSNYQSYVLAARPRTAAAGWQLAPNPTTGTVVLTPAPGNTAALHTVQVLNSLGQVVWQPALAPSATRPGPLDLSALPAGLYTVRLHTAAGIVAQRLVKE